MQKAPPPPPPPPPPPSSRRPSGRAAEVLAHLAASAAEGVHLLHSVSLEEVSARVSAKRKSCFEVNEETGDGVHAASDGEDDEAGQRLSLPGSIDLAPEPAVAISGDAGDPEDIDQEDDEDASADARRRRLKTRAERRVARGPGIQ